MTFKELSTDWYNRFISKYALKEAKRKQYLLNRFILPFIGHLTINQLSPRYILEKVLRPIEDKGILETAYKVKSLLSLIFKYGVAIGQVDRNIIADIAGAIPSPNVTHRATILNPKEIGRLLAAIRLYKGQPSVAYALRILPYVFVRPGELRHAEWAEIDLEAAIWRIPAEKMKMKAPHLVPLSRQVVELLRELKVITGDGKYLFPGARVKNKPISDAAVNAALRYLGFSSKEIVGHGFRAMASTLLNEQGFQPDWIERQLAHCERNSVRAAYNHADYLKERIGMMQAWADYLDSLVTS
jgi:integrase